MEKTKNYGFLHAKKIEFINEINSLKTLAQLGEGGPRQWWVRDQFVWELEKMNQSETQKTFARQLRSEQTEVEQQLWRALRNRRLQGVKFRRQHPVPPYVLDFYCHAAKLAIELDGSQHIEQETYDQQRTAFLNQQGIHVLRFWNQDVLKHQEAVMETIWKTLRERGVL